MSLRIHLRRLLRSRVFLVTAILVLGLGLGVNLILFNTAYALLWRPLNFPQPNRLVTLVGRSNSGDLSTVATGLDAATLRSEPVLFSDVGLTGQRRLVSLFQQEEGVDMASAAVDSGYFRALGLRPVLGRFFGPEEDLSDTPERPAVLAESAWRAHFGADPSIVGRSFVLQEGGRRRAARVIGIVPGSATLPFAPDAEILLPIASGSPAVRMNYGDALYRCVMRLRPGVTVSQASARIDPVLQRGWGRHWLEPLRSAVAPVKRQTILFIYGAACLLLLLTSANLASLFVARSAARAQETAVHQALGASRQRMISANFCEALLVCGAGTALAFLVERWAAPLVPRFIPAVKNVGPELLATGPVLVAAGILICLAVSIVVSAASGVRFRVATLAEILAQGGRSGGSRSAGRFRAALAAGQLAIVLTLLTVSGLVGRSFVFALRSDPGLNPRGVATVQLSLPQRTPVATISNLAVQMAAMPGIRGVVFAAEAPVGSPAFSTVTSGREGDLQTTDPMIPYRLIGPSYFETLGTKVSSGRTFSQEEVQQSRNVAILNESAARLLFPGDSAIGRKVHSGFGDRRSLVIGIVHDIRTDGLDQAAAPAVYLPYLSGFGLRFVIRTAGDPAGLLPLLRDRMRSAAPGVLLQRFRPLTEILDETVRDRMTSGMLVGGFALLGLIISSVGLSGTLAAQVQEQRREIGVRIALGATTRNVVAGVLRDGLWIVGCGTAAGIGGSAFAGLMIRRELYGVGPLDFVAFVAALTILLIAALTGCLIPAFHAGQVDPIRTLNAQ